MTRSRPQVGLSTILAAACALALAACGASSASSGGTGTSANPAQAARNHQSFLNFAKCMRSHGVPNFPDPIAGGGIQLSSGINPSSPAFVAAQKACTHLLPDGGPGNRKPSEQEIKRLLTLAECMRAHGLTNFPDPTTTPPTPTPGSVVMGINGVFLDLGAAGLNPSSPAFERAATACNFPLAHRSSGPDAQAAP